MKTERRHELQTNQLADSLAHLIESIKPYSRAVLALVVAAAVLIFAWAYMSGQNSRRLAQGWNEYFDAISPTNRDPRDQLSDIANRYAGTPVAEWARLVLADIQLQVGTDQLFVQRKDSRDELRNAAEKYRAVLVESRQPAVRQHATYGLARAHEALGTPDSLEEARNEYRSIGQQWPGCAYATAAEARAKDLDAAATKSFYDWVAKYEPPRPMSREPGTPGARPDFLKDSLDEGVKLPSVLDNKGAAPQGDAAPGPALGDSPPATSSEPAPESAAPESK